MKLKELKERYKNRFSMRMIAGVLCVALAGGSFGVYRLQVDKLTAAGRYFTEEERAAAKKGADTKQKAGKQKADQAVKETLTEQLTAMLASEGTQSLDAKEETVYLITDANGAVRQTIVSSWLKNGSAEAVIEDATELTEIENVKGDETFAQNGQKLTWQANGQDIFYRGTTQKEPPLSEKLTYYLDGQEISPQDLAGKSGKVTIRFDYTNSAKTTADINGKTAEIYVPFTVVSGMVLDESFRNVRVNNGRVLSDGNRLVAVGIAMPGLKESLDVDEKDFDEDFEFPDHVEVTADVENFSLEMTATVAVAGLMSNGGFSERLDFSELEDTLDEMSDAMGQLKNGGGDLADGLDTLQESMGGFSDGVGTLANGMNAYTDGVSKLADGIHSLDKSSETLESGVNVLKDSAKTISDGVQKLDQTLRAEITEKEQAAIKKKWIRRLRLNLKKEQRPTIGFIRRRFRTLSIR